MASLSDVNLMIIMPGVPWLPSLSLTLGIPAKGLTGDTECGFAKGVPYPFPSLLIDFIFCWYLVVLPPEICIVDDIVEFFSGIFILGVNVHKPHGLFSSLNATYSLIYLLDGSMGHLRVNGE